MERLQKGLEISGKEDVKESYLTPTIIQHDNLKQITRDVLNFSYSSDDEVPPPPVP
jgi:hypothetical protein